MQPQAISLLELNTAVHESLNRAFPDTYWVIAEISEVRENRNGHCYLELVEKDEVSDNIVARAKGIIWANVYKMLKPYFENATGQTLADGLKILAFVNVQFHELYGYSLQIRDIDPNYTIGDIARKKQETIEKLKAEGVYDMNKNLTVSLSFQRIAVISSSTAAGYGDFKNQLGNNPYGYKFYLKIFPSIMQGEQAEQSIISALEQIYKYESFFDAVVIIRGGGAQADLHCFNSYWLAYHVAQYPLPVITGIGHERDETVIDIVAYQKMKTPTAVAEYLIEKMIELDNKIKALKDQFIEKVNYRLEREKATIQMNQQKILPGVKNILLRKETRLKLKVENIKHELKIYANNRKQDWLTYRNSLRSYAMNWINKEKRYMADELIRMEKATHGFFEREHYKLDLKKNTIKHVDPAYILKKGFSYTMKEGSVITDSKTLKHNDEIISFFYKGKAKSIVKKR